MDTSIEHWANLCKRKQKIKLVSSGDNVNLCQCICVDTGYFSRSHGSTLDIDGEQKIEDDIRCFYQFMTWFHRMYLYCVTGITWITLPTFKMWIICKLCKYYLSCHINYGCYHMWRSILLYLCTYFYIDVLAQSIGMVKVISSRQLFVFSNIYTKCQTYSAARHVFIEYLDFCFYKFWTLHEWF